MINIFELVLFIEIEKILDLSLNSYLGIFFILLGLVVRIQLKFGIQKDLP